MNKSGLAERLAGRAGMSRGAAKNAVDGVFDVIVEALEDGEEVRIAGFGTFGTRSRPAQAGLYRTEPKDRGGGFDIGVDVAYVQGQEDAEGCR